MTAYFFDASALVKRYLREVGSEWVRQLIAHERPRIFISSLSGVEVLAAIMRKGRAGEFSPPERDKALRAFRREFATSYALIPPESRRIRDQGSTTPLSSSCSITSDI